MEDSTSKLRAQTIAIMLFRLGVLSVLTSALWKWFVVPLGVPPVSLSQAAGILLLFLPITGIGIRIWPPKGFLKPFLEDHIRQLPEFLMTCLGIFIVGFALSFLPF